jgi:hypothetical protein
LYKLELRAFSARKFAAIAQLFDRTTRGAGMLASVCALVQKTASNGASGAQNEAGKACAGSEEENALKGAAFEALEVCRMCFGMGFRLCCPRFALAVAIFAFIWTHLATKKSSED